MPRVCEIGEGIEATKRMERHGYRDQANGRIAALQPMQGSPRTPAPLGEVGGADPPDASR